MAESEGRARAGRLDPRAGRTARLLPRDLIPAPAAASPPAVAATTDPAWPPPGFRHLFPELGPPPAPPPGQDPRRSEAARKALADRLAALALAMEAESPLDAAGDNETIPAGYTYLLQFVAHDIVRTETPVWAIGTRGRTTRDLAVARLRLDTLYGGGPVACPFAYASGGRDRLRIAPMGRGPGDPAAMPLRDIPRTRLDPALRPGATARLDEALLPDPRNDDNSNVAQMTVLFSAFHNAVVERLLAPAGLPPAMRYAVAREAVTLVYRRILREDLLKRLLHPLVHERYRGRRDGFLDAPRDAAEAARMPLEFCLGAFRCGHAMVRETYVINDGPVQELGGVLRATSGGISGPVPLPRPWIVRWSRFFEIAGRGRPKPNPSRLLRPQHSPGLLDTFFFGDVDHTRRVGLAYRDLLGAGVAGLRSVDDLWHRVATADPALAHGDALHDPTQRRDALTRWLALEEVPAGHAAALAAEPPLPFYVLFEAMHQRGGLTLGTLGSVIVAETLLGQLARDPLPSEAAGDPAPEALSRLAREVGMKPGALDAIAGIDAMPGLVLFAAQAEGIGARDPAFV